MTAIAPRHDGAAGFMRHQATGGVLLVGAAIAALLVANSSLQGLERGFLGAPIGLSPSGIVWEKPLLPFSAPARP